MFAPAAIRNFEQNAFIRFIQLNNPRIISYTPAGSVVLRAACPPFLYTSAGVDGPAGGLSPRRRGRVRLRAAGRQAGVKKVRAYILNIALGFLGVLVHAIRLNTLEFSNHMEMQWGGIRYKPFSKTNNYLKAHNKNEIKF